MNEKLFDKILLECEKEDIRFFAFGGQGEPTLHPSLFLMIRATRRMFPAANIHVATNGSKVRERKDLSYIVEAFNAGVTHMVLDAYDKETFDIFNKEKHKLTCIIAEGYKENFIATEKNNILVVNDPDLANFQSKRKLVTKANTQGSSMPYEHWKKFGIQSGKFPMEKSCKELNKYMAIKFDGKVPVCCADGSRSFFVGDITNQTIREVWKGKTADVARWALHRRLRKLLPPCYACDRPSYRDALWVHWGKQYSVEEMLKEIINNSDPSEHWVDNMAKLGTDYKLEEPITSLVYSSWDDKL